MRHPVVFGPKYSKNIRIPNYLLTSVRGSHPVPSLSIIATERRVEQFSIATLAVFTCILSHTPFRSFSHKANYRYWIHYRLSIDLKKKISVGWSKTHIYIYYLYLEWYDVLQIILHLNHKIGRSKVIEISKDHNIVK